jgi:hypothetical protein
MARNILVFSDGTGQRGGVLFEERRTNIYKLYRATRSGPDSAIDPSQQVAFYDAGIGTIPGGLTSAARLALWIYNTVGQATGLGLTANIVDCYTAIIRAWQPGDRIFLFGFSRGAYTVRCVAGVLALCGVPTLGPGGQPLKRNEAGARTIARKAVHRVYQHFRPVKETPAPDAKPDDLRKALAQRFRAEHGSDADGKSNAFPYFIGVFDTVASLANRGVLVALAVGTLAVLAGLSALACGVLSYPFWTVFGGLAAAVALVALAAYLWTHFKIAFGLPGYPWWRTMLFTPLWMQFYDRNLSRDVGFARHALAIDEHRGAFDRVPWGSPRDHKQTEPVWFQQIWFAGNHSDIGGSYPEDESRLSDITLKWMVEAAQAVPNGLKFDPSVLRLYPACAGMQHDETKRGLFQFAKKINRTVPPDAPLHDTVYERAALATVLNYDLMEQYRPTGLEAHAEFCRRCNEDANTGHR